MEKKIIDGRNKYEIRKKYVEIEEQKKRMKKEDLLKE